MADTCTITVEWRSPDNMTTRHYPRTLPTHAGVEWIPGTYGRDGHWSECTRCGRYPED